MYSGPAGGRASWSRSHVWLYSGHEEKSEISLSLAFCNSFNSRAGRALAARDIDYITELNSEFSNYFREFGKYLALRTFIQLLDVRAST